MEKAIIDFPKKVKNGENWKAKQYREKKKEIADKVSMLKYRGINLHLRWGISDFEDEEFYGFLRRFRTEQGDSDGFGKRS